MAHRRARGRRVAPRTRPRYKRLTAAGAAAGVTMVAVLGGIGWLPQTATGEVLSASGKADADRAVPAAASARPRGRSGAASPAAPPSAGTSPRTARASTVTPDTAVPPAGSGTGRRVVFDLSAQRVWLVVHGGDGHDAVRRTYLVSGSVSDNLKPATYTVYSRSRHAWGIDDSGTMGYFVRFAHGVHAAIGFHDIPIKDGVPLQSRADLGTPQSHGCIRQWRPDAQALWRFAGIGTKVVVVA